MRLKPLLKEVRTISMPNQTNLGNDMRAHPVSISTLALSIDEIQSIEIIHHSQTDVPLVILVIFATEHSL